MANIVTIPEGSICYPLYADLFDNTGHERIKFEQYDANSRYIKASLYKDGVFFPITDSHIVTFSCTKPHTKYGVTNECGRDVEGNVIYIVSDQTTSEDGLFKGQFTVYDTYLNGSTTMSRRIGTPTFNIFVEKAALDDNTIMSTNEFNILTNLITTIGDLVTDATQALVDMNTALEAEIIRVSNETTRISNENVRIEHDAVRPIWYYITQAQYDALTQLEKDDPIKVYQITDSQDSNLTNELQVLIDNTNTAKVAAENVVLQRNGINDSAINTIETWSSDKITKRIRTATYTASATVSNVVHNLDYTPSTDDIIVIYSGVLLEETLNYTHSVDYKSINLVGWTISSGDKVFFKLYKNVK